MKRSTLSPLVTLSPALLDTCLRVSNDALAMFDNHCFPPDKCVNWQDLKTEWKMTQYEFLDEFGMSECTFFKGENCISTEPNFRSGLGIPPMVNYNADFYEAIGSIKCRRHNDSSVSDELRAFPSDSIPQPDSLSLKICRRDPHWPIECNFKRLENNGCHDLDRQTNVITSNTKHSQCRLYKEKGCKIFDKRISVEEDKPDGKDLNIPQVKSIRCRYLNLCEAVIKSLKLYIQLSSRAHGGTQHTINFGIWGLESGPIQVFKNPWNGESFDGDVYASDLRDANVTLSQLTELYLESRIEPQKVHPDQISVDEISLAASTSAGDFFAIWNPKDFLPIVTAYNVFKSMGTIFEEKITWHQGTLEALRDNQLDKW